MQYRLNDEMDNILLSSALIYLVSFTVHAKDVSFCFKSATHYNVILSGGLEAGKYKPWEPSDESHMTHDRCTEHCCKSPDTDVVFLLNR